jgi:hypothetical protein
VQHPRAKAKEDSASLWDFYTFILLSLRELPEGALLSVSIIPDFYTTLQKNRPRCFSIRIHFDTLQIELKVIARERDGEFGKTV